MVKLQAVLLSAATAASMLSLAGDAGAASMTPIATSGYSVDVIAEGSNPGAQTNADISSWIYYQEGAGTTTAGSGLPVGGSFTHGTTTFQFAPYTGNNAIIGSGSVTLTTPAAYSQIAFLTESQGQNGASFSATIHFSDSSTASTGTLAHADWTVGDTHNALVAGLSHPTDATTQTDYPGVFLYEDDFTIPVGQAGLSITSIDFTQVSGAEVLFAVSGTASPTPEPTTLGLIAMAGMGLLRRRRRSTSL